MRRPITLGSWATTCVHTICTRSPIKTAPQSQVKAWLARPILALLVELVEQAFRTLGAGADDEGVWKQVLRPCTAHANWQEACGWLFIRLGQHHPARVLSTLHQFCLPTQTIATGILEQLVVSNAKAVRTSMLALATMYIAASDEVHAAGNAPRGSPLKKSGPPPVVLDHGRAQEAGGGSLATSSDAPRWRCVLGYLLRLAVLASNARGASAAQGKAHCRVPGQCARVRLGTMPLLELWPCTLTPARPFPARTVNPAGPFGVAGRFPRNAGHVPREPVSPHWA